VYAAPKRTSPLELVTDEEAGESAGGVGVGVAGAAKAPPLLLAPPAAATAAMTFFLSLVFQ
jgi:hypothetical protein